MENLRIFTITSRQGWAHKLNTPYEEIADTEGAKTTLRLMVKVVEFNERRVKFEIIRGSIMIDDTVYMVRKGHGGALVNKFGWITLRGIAVHPEVSTVDASSEYRFYLEGMLHIEPGDAVVVTGHLAARIEDGAVHGGADGEGGAGVL